MANYLSEYINCDSFQNITLTPKKVPWV